jgi:hypothetical protein
MNPMNCDYTKRELSKTNGIELFFGVIFPAIVFLPFGIIGGITMIFLSFTTKPDYILYLLLGLDFVSLASLYVLYILIVYGVPQIAQRPIHRICALVILILGVTSAAWLSWHAAQYMLDAIKSSKSPFIAIFPVLSFLFVAGPAIVGTRYLFQLLKCGGTDKD